MLLETIVSLRGYSRAKFELDNTKNKADVKPTSAHDRVWKIQKVIMDASKEKRECDD